MFGEPERKRSNVCDPIQGNFPAIAQKAREREREESYENLSQESRYSD
jgi:hypothetical protein